MLVVVEVLVVVGLNGAALVVVDVVLVEVDVVVVLVGIGIIVVVDVVLVEVDVDDMTIMFKVLKTIIGFTNVLNLNSTFIVPKPVVKKLVIPLYLVPPGIVGDKLV